MRRESLCVYPSAWLKGLGVGASVRALPEAGKEVLSEHVVRVLAPSANGFARIAPKTPALDFFLCNFLFASRQKGKLTIQDEKVKVSYSRRKSEYLTLLQALNPQNRLLGSSHLRWPVPERYSPPSARRRASCGHYLVLR